MYLKSLTLRGFKSFADKTMLTLEPGVTVIVGPNGSGKSNISDAVLWVLGEQSAKTLRGNAMEDVIFAGSSARPAVGVAEVSLVLDNSDGTLPLEFTEVTITRRMYRSGESEYLINNAPARLLDILDLLHDSGLGRDTRSIISQGRLDEVLLSKPEDRRLLIEEAAGVLKHKKRKERALRKLAGLEAHLARARDIAHEIDRQLRPLERQATKADTHAELVRRARSLEVALAVDTLRSLQAEWERIAKQEREADAEIELARYRLAEKQAELERFQSLLEQKGLFVGDLAEQRRRMASILERLDAGLLLLEEKGKNLVARLSELRAKLHQAEGRVQTRHEELTALALERAETDARLQALYAQLAELRRETEAARKARIHADEEVSRLAGEIRQVRRRVDEDRVELARAEQALASARLERDLVAERIEQLEEQERSAISTLSARRSRVDMLERTIQSLTRDIALANADVDKRVRLLDARRKELDERRGALTEARAEAKGLEEVDTAFAAASPALAWALTTRAAETGVLGPLSDALHAAPDVEALVERLLGADLFALLVADVETAERIVAELPDDVRGEVSLLPVADMLPGEPLTIAGTRRLVELIDTSETVRPVLEALLGDVHLVDDLAHARQLRERLDRLPRFATPDGTVLWPSGKVTVGAQVSDTEGVLARKRRINQLLEEVEALTAQVGEAEAAVAAAEEALIAAQQDALELSQRLAALTGERDSLLAECARLEEQIQGLQAESRSLSRRLGEIAEKLEREQPDIDALTARIEHGEAELSRLEEAHARARESRDARFRDETAISERLSACQVDIATVSEREVHLRRQLKAIETDLAELTETIERSRETEVALELLRERIQPLHDCYIALQEHAEHWAGRLRDRSRLEQADSESLRETIAHAQQAVREARAEIDERTAAIQEVRVAKGQVEIQVEQAVRRIVEELGVPLETALASEPVEDRAAVEDELHLLRKRIAQLGPVNPVAREEYEALKARRDFIGGQAEDLDASRLALGKIIAAIDRKIRDRFLETFEEVDRHFQDVFAILFPGGRAQLQLTDPDSPDTTGVEIVAQPRGKRIGKMSLLSGGERALTALALLFALYRTRPCPFYILDEVEAALDDVNLRRFCALLDSMRAETQFIVVTHQRRTMEAADVLYGVSMQADGVSKVVSQRLDRIRTERSADGHAVA